MKMRANLSDQIVKSEPLNVVTHRTIDSIGINAGFVTFRYSESVALRENIDDVITSKAFTVGRELQERKTDTVEFNGQTISLDDWVKMGVAFAEKFRLENEEPKKLEAAAEVMVAAAKK